MKKILFILFTALTLVACKSNSSIITSKSEAKKKGIYTNQVGSTLGNSKIETVSRSNTNTTLASKNYSKSKPSDVLIKKETTYNSTDINRYRFADDLINEAKNYLGVRYRAGGTTTSGMDCSGLVTTVFKEFDFSLPRSSKDMALVGEKIKSSKIEPGDLVFFKTNGRSVINHVGLVVDVDGDEFKFIHSSTSLGVIISSNQEAYYKRTFAQANRVL